MISLSYNNLSLFNSDISHASQRRSVTTEFNMLVLFLGIFAGLNIDLFVLLESNILVF